MKIIYVGAGALSAGAHYPALSEMQDVEIAGMCDINEERLNEIGDKFNVTNRFIDYREMFRSVEAEAVFIVLPPRLLFDPVMDALEAGLHVYIDKPPGLTLWQTQRMAEKAAKKGCRTMVGFNRRYNPLMRKMKNLVEEKGGMKQVVATFYKSPAKSQYYVTAAVDILTHDVIHCVDALRWLGGEPARVCSAVGTGTLGIETRFNAVVEFENGAAGVLLSDYEVGVRTHTFEMHGTDISVFVNPGEEAAVYEGGKKDPAVFSAIEEAESDRYYRYYGYYNEDRHFLDCVKENSEPETSFADAVKTMKLVEGIRRNSV